MEVLVMERYQKIFADRDTRFAGFLCRAINFLEDLVEDADCKNIYVSVWDLDSFKLVLEPVDCSYDLYDSIRVFSKEYDLENVDIGTGDLSYSGLYDHLIDHYRNNIHVKLLEVFSRNIHRSVEYYMGILWDGRAFIVEGESDRVIIPGINHCLSAHTHPSQYPIPSSVDLKTITRLMLDRGIGHVVVAQSSSLAIYRVKPLTINDLEFINSMDYGDPEYALKHLSELSSIRLRYL